MQAPFVFIWVFMNQTLERGFPPFRLVADHAITFQTEGESGEGEMVRDHAAVAGIDVVGMALEPKRARGAVRS
jgi:hypothetical protein